MKRYAATYIPEPDLVFGGRQEEKDPRLGLGRFGPFQASGEHVPSPSQVRIGIVGTGQSISIIRRAIDALGKPIKSAESNRWLYPDYEGFSLEAAIRCEFVISSPWTVNLRPQELESVFRIKKSRQRIAACANIFVEKVGLIAGEEPPPDVIILGLDDKTVEHCGIGRRTRGAKDHTLSPTAKKKRALSRQNQKFLEGWGFEVKEPEAAANREEDFDLRNAIKGKVMKFGIPVQLLHVQRAQGFLSLLKDGKALPGNVTEPTGFAWDLSTGLYYKAKGKPWRLAKLPEGSCYVGIYFFRNLRSPDHELQTSMAQVFTHNGDGFVLRGEDVRTDRITHEPYMTREQAKKLLVEVLRKYEEKSGAPAGRVVIHKKSTFAEPEKDGFLSIIGERHYDFVTITGRAPTRFFRLGEYPVLRGTMIGLTDDEFLLYTGGYTPRIRTYPGRRAPRPLLVKHEGSTEIEDVCSEIMGLTKLNWNTTQFATNYPITLEFAHKVSKVLSDIRKGAPLQDHYRFYM